MRLGAIGLLVAAGIILPANAAFAGGDSAVFSACLLCTCQDGAVLCLDSTDGDEVIDELGPCGPACSEINSSYKSSELVETPCEDLPTCDHAETPAASPLAMSVAALGLVAFGALLLRRNRERSGA